MTDPTKKRTATSSLQLNPWGCLATMGFVVAVCVVAALRAAPPRLGATPSREEARPNEEGGDPHADAFVPSIADAPLEQQRQTLGADLAFVVTGTPELRAFTTRAGQANWWVAFYEPRDGAWTRLDPLFAPTGYDEPQIVGDPPMLTMRLRSADVPFRFRREGDAMVFEPAPPVDLGDGEPVR